MKVHQVLVQKEDNSMYSFGIYQSRSLAESLRAAINESGYLNQKDRAVVTDVPVFAESKAVLIEKKPRKKSAPVSKLGKKVDYQEQAQAEVNPNQLQ